MHVKKEKGPDRKKAKGRFVKENEIRGQVKEECFFAGEAEASASRKSYFVNSTARESRARHHV